MTDASREAAPAFRIGVISDTHGFLPDSATDALAGVDAIVHAGDIGDGYVLDVLETIAPVTAVRGNNRYAAEHALPVVANVCLGGVRVMVAHYLHDLPHVTAPGQTDARIIVAGHTHIPHAEERHGVLWVNPGSPTQPRGGSKPAVAIVSVGEGGDVSVELRDLDR